MPRTQINIDVETALIKIKKDIVRKGGSCMLIVVNDGEIMNHGGGEADSGTSVLAGMKRRELVALPQAEASRTLHTRIIYARRDKRLATPT